MTYILRPGPYIPVAWYEFDPALVTFGAGMAIRSGDVFGGAPIVQGTLAVTAQNGNGKQ